jgi:hypothetical protein
MPFIVHRKRFIVAIITKKPYRHQNNNGSDRFALFTTTERTTMKLLFGKLALAASLVLLAGPAAVGMGQADNQDLLQTLEKGLWQLRAIGGGASTAASSQLCVSDPKMLAQIQHGGNSCSHFVVRSTANSVTISYSCKGAGQGLTTIRKETGRLVQIQSQGIRNNSPFSFSVEGRRAGAC